MAGMSKWMHYFIGAIIVFSVGTQDIQGAHKQLNSMGGSVEHRPVPSAHGPVIFARMVRGNEKIFTPELKHEEIRNSQITTNNNK